MGAVPARSAYRWTVSIVVALALSFLPRVSVADDVPPTPATWRTAPTPSAAAADPEGAPPSGWEQIPSNESTDPPAEDPGAPTPSAGGGAPPAEADGEVAAPTGTQTNPAWEPVDPEPAQDDSDPEPEQGSQTIPTPLPAEDGTGAQTDTAVFDGQAQSLHRQQQNPVVSFRLEETGNSGVSGTATLAATDAGGTSVSISVSGNDAGSLTALVSGICPEPNAATYDLLEPLDESGQSSSILSNRPLDGLRGSSAIVVFYAVETGWSYQACGDVPAANPDAETMAATGQENALTSTGVGSTAAKAAGDSLSATLTLLALVCLAGAVAIRYRWRSSGIGSGPSHRVAANPGPNGGHGR